MTDDNITEKIRDYLIWSSENRNTGRTTHQINKCISDGKIYVVHNERFRTQLINKYPELKVVSVKNPNHLRGIPYKDIEYDHFVIEDMVSQLLYLLIEKESNIIKSTRKLEQIQTILDN